METLGHQKFTNANGSVLTPVDSQWGVHKLERNTMQTPLKQ